MDGRADKCMGRWMSARTHAHAHARARTRTRARTRAHTHTHARAHTHTRARTHTRGDIHLSALELHYFHTHKLFPSDISDHEILPPEWFQTGCVSSSNSQYTYIELTQFLKSENQCHWKPLCFCNNAGPQSPELLNSTIEWMRSLNEIHLVFQRMLSGRQR